MEEDEDGERFRPSCESDLRCGRISRYHLYWRRSQHRHDERKKNSPKDGRVTIDNDAQRHHPSPNKEM